MPLLPANGSAESTENWCVDGLIKFEKPSSGLEELSLNPVSYIAKTKKRARSRCSNNAVTLIEQSLKK